MRRLLAQPSIWAAVLLAAAILLMAPFHGLEFLSFLCALAAGLFAGQAVLGAISRISSRSMSLIVHIAVVAAAWVLAFPLLGGFGVSGLDGLMGAAYFAVYTALLVATAWLSLALLGRLIALIPGGSRGGGSADRGGSPGVDRGVDRRAPEWHAAPDGGAAIEFDAVPLGLRALVSLIVIAAVLGGAGVFALMVSLPIFDALPPRLGVVLAAVLVGVPIALAFRSFLRARTRPYRVQFLSRRAVVHVGDRSSDWAYAELDALVWRTDTEYARVELVSPHARLSLLVGQVKPARGRQPRLQELSRRMRAALEQAGLVEEPGRARDLTRYRRPPRASAACPASAAASDSVSECS